MKFIVLIFSISIFMSCGGGGSSVASNSNSGSSASSNPNEGLSLLPGSVNSFQPLDIDD